MAGHVVRRDKQKQIPTLGPIKGQHVTGGMVIGLHPNALSSIGNNCETECKQILYNVAWQHGYDWAKFLTTIDFNFDAQCVHNAVEYAKEYEEHYPPKTSEEGVRALNIFNTNVFAFILGAVDQIRDRNV